MTFAGFLENQAGVGRTLSAGPTTGLGESVAASFDFTWKAHTTAAAIQYQGAPLNERNDMIKQRFGQDIYDITGLRTKYTNPSAEGRVAMLKEANDKIDDWIAKGRVQEPEKYAGIKTSAEIREAARKTVNTSENHMNEIMARNPSGVSRMTGGFIGGVGATLLDPPNLLTLPLGAGEIQAGLKGWAAARAILKAAAIDGTINAGIEAVNQPAIMAWQKELGRRYGFGDAVENVAMAFVGGAGLSSILRSAGRGLDYVGSVSMDALDKIARSERLPASVRNAASFMSRQAHIDESAPPGAIKTGEDLKVHRDTAQKIADEFEHYKPPSHNGAEIKPSTAQAAAAEKAAPEVKAETVTETVTTDQASYNLDGIVKRAEDQGVKLAVAESDKSISVGKIVVPKEARGGGIGTKTMEELTAYADQAGKTVTLTPSKDFGGSSVKRLTDFYKRFGFVENKGNKKDFAISDTMYREPKKPKKAKAQPTAAPVDKMDDIAPTERIQPVKMPEGLTPEVSADRVAIAESDMKALVDEVGDETITLDDGRAVSIKDFAEEIQAKKKVIEAMKTCRIA